MSNFQRRSSPAPARKAYVPYKRATTARATTARATTARAPARRAAPRYQRATVSGRGAYKKDYGARLGSVVGEGVQELLAQVNPLRLFGFGDYAPYPYPVKANTLLSMGNDPPEVRNMADGRVILRHREYVKDILTGAAGAFNIESFSINPGDSKTFPWLCNIARSFEQYSLRGCIFEFKSTSADALNSVNTALGTIIMATEYDSAKPGFKAKIDMENHQYAASARQSQSMLHPIECASKDTPITKLYVRDPESELEGTDIRLYDWGKFQIATVGQQGSNVNIGELWITYEVELLKPNFVDATYLDDTLYRRSTTATNKMFQFDKEWAPVPKAIKVTFNASDDSLFVQLSPEVQSTYFVMYTCAFATGASMDWQGPIFENMSGVVATTTASVMKVPSNTLFSEGYTGPIVWFGSFQTQEDYDAPSFKMRFPGLPSAPNYAATNAQIVITRLSKGSIQTPVSLMKAFEEYRLEEFLRRGEILLSEQKSPPLPSDPEDFTMSTRDMILQAVDKAKAKRAAIKL